MKYLTKRKGFFYSPPILILILMHTRASPLYNTSLEVYIRPFKTIGNLSRGHQALESSGLTSLLVPPGMPPPPCSSETPLMPIVIPPVTFE